MHDDYKEPSENQSKMNLDIDPNSQSKLEFFEFCCNDLRQAIIDKNTDKIKEILTSFEQIPEEDFSFLSKFILSEEYFGSIVELLEAISNYNDIVDEQSFFILSQLIYEGTASTDIDLINMISAQLINTLDSMLKTKIYPTSNPHIIGIVKNFLCDKTTFKITSFTFTLDFICNYIKYLSDFPQEIQSDTFVNILCCLCEYSKRQIISDDSYKIIQTIAENTELIDSNECSQELFFATCQNLVDAQVFDSGLANKYGIIRISNEYLYSSNIRVQSAAASFLQRIGACGMLPEAYIPDFDKLIEHMSTIDESSLFSKFALFFQQISLSHVDLFISHIPNLIQLFNQIFMEGKNDIGLVFAAIINLPDIDMEIFFTPEIVNIFVDLLDTNLNSPFLQSYLTALMSLRAWAVQSNRDADWFQFLGEKAEDIDDLTYSDELSPENIEILSLLIENTEET